MTTENIRKYVLLTLTHAELGARSHYTPHFVASKCRSLFNCEAVVVSKELHKAGGYHYHVGVLNDTATRYTCTSKLRSAFSEFEGRQLNVSFHKSWNTICAYLLKQDKNPFCWGTTKEECMARSSRAAGKKSVNLVYQLKACKTWDEVLENEVLCKAAVRSYSSLKQVWLDLHGQEKLLPLEDRLREYLRLSCKNGSYERLEAYTPSELGDRDLALKWCIINLAGPREHRQPQLLLLGPPRVGKSDFMRTLGEFLNIYQVPLRKDDFEGATLSCDLWVVDEFTRDRFSSPVLNLLLDGQKVRLDAKYSRGFLKDRNLPIVLITNNYPDMGNKVRQEAFDTRVTSVTLSSVKHLSGPRLAKTLLEGLVKLKNVVPQLSASSDYVAVLL